MMPSIHIPNGRFDSQAAQCGARFNEGIKLHVTANL
jgi:hypothetical protein